MSLQIEPGHVEEIKALVEEGDVDLKERRKTFEVHTGRPTTLSDENLIRAIAATNDDDDDLFVQNVLIAEKE